MSGIVDLLHWVNDLVPEGGGTVGATVGVVAGILLVRHVAGRLQERFSGADRSMDRLAVSGVTAILTGFGVLLLVGIWGLLTPLIVAYLELELAEYGEEVILAVVLLAGAYALTSFIGRIIQEVASSPEHITEHQREVIYRLTQVTLYTFVGLIVVTLFTRNLGSLLVGAGFLGIIVGMAARQMLGAVLAGFVLMFSRPFEIGDWVEVDDYEGTVAHISIVNTRIQTFDGEYVVIPNDQVSGNAITNRTRKGRLRVEVEVGVDYDADPETAAEVALDAVERLDVPMNVPSAQVVLKQFADSAVVLGVRFWIDNPTARRLWRARTAAIAAVKEDFEAEGIKIPFPQRELAARSEEGGFRLTDDREADARATTDGGGR